MIAVKSEAKISKAVDQTMLDYHLQLSEKIGALIIPRGDLLCHHLLLCPYGEMVQLLTTKTKRGSLKVASFK